MVDENHQNMSKGGCKLSHHAIQIVKIVPCRPCPWKTGKLGRNNTCHKFVLAWWHGNNENRACKQVRFHSILDGSSLAHAIQVLMGPLLMNYGRMRCTEMKRLLETELDTHTVGKNPPGSRTIVRVQAETER